MNIRHPHPLILEAIEVRDALLLNGGHDELIRKLDDLLSLPFLHGGQQEKLHRLLMQARQ